MPTDLIRQLNSSDSQQSAQGTMSLSGSSDVFSRIFDQLHLQESRIEGKFPIGDASQVIYVCCRLLRVLTAASSVSGRMLSMVAKQTVSRLLTHFQRLWAIINETSAFMIGQATDNHRPIREFFECLTCLSEHIADARENLCWVQRFCLQWTTCMLDFAGWHSDEEAQVDQAACVYIATATVAAIQRIPALASLIEEQLSPMRWEDIDANQIDPEMLQQRSQVSDHLVSHTNSDLWRTSLSLPTCLTESEIQSNQTLRRISPGQTVTGPASDPDYQQKTLLRDQIALAANPYFV